MSIDWTASSTGCSRKAYLQVVQLVGQHSNLVPQVADLGELEIGGLSTLFVALRVRLCHFILMCGAASMLLLLLLRLRAWSGSCRAWTWWQHGAEALEVQVMLLDLRLQVQ